jgi:RNA polymerase sigma factor (sigma-70 family)
MESREPTTAWHPPESLKRHAREIPTSVNTDGRRSGHKAGASNAEVRSGVRRIYRASASQTSEPTSRDQGASDRFRSGGSGSGDVESTFHVIERARASDQEAIERLFARHLKPLQRWASGRLPKWARDRADTDDLVQETLIQTFKRIEDFEPRRVGALQAYLRQAVLNRIRNELRRKGRQPHATDLDGIEVRSVESPLEQAIGREAVECYERALQRLTAGEREAIIGRVEMGYSYEEMAEALGKPTADAARKAAQRALVRLVEEMKRGDQ